MNTSEGLKRIAQLVRWFANGLAGLLFFVGIALLLFGSGDRGDAGWMFLLFVIFAAVVCAVGAGVAWVIEGFAEPRKDK